MSSLFPIYECVHCMHFGIVVANNVKKTSIKVFGNLLFLHIVSYISVSGFSYLRSSKILIIYIYRNILLFPSIRCFYAFWGFGPKQDENTEKQVFLGGRSFCFSIKSATHAYFFFLVPKNLKNTDNTRFL